MPPSEIPPSERPKSSERRAPNVEPVNEEKKKWIDRTVKVAYELEQRLKDMPVLTEEAPEGSLAGNIDLMEERYNQQMKDRINGIKAREALGTGKELGRKYLSDETQNTVSRRVYKGEGGPPYVAFVKLEGEQTHREVKPDGTLIETRGRRDPETGKLTESKTEGLMDPEEFEEAGQNMERREEFRQSAAEYYGVSPDEVPMDNEGCPLRNGIKEGTRGIRNYVCKRLADKVGLGDVIPECVLRPEKNAKGEVVDLACVTQKARSEGPSTKLGPLDKKTYQDLLALGPVHPKWPFAMKAARAHFALLETDGNPLNTSGNQIFDQGEALPISNESGPLDPIKSVYLEIIRKWPNAKESEMELSTMKGFVEKCEASGTGEPSGEDFEYVCDLFRLLYPNEKIAKKEALGFYDRVKEIATLGRPPDLPIWEPGKQGRCLRPCAQEAFETPQEKAQRKLGLLQPAAAA
jgi:hypothetical protein